MRRYPALPCSLFLLLAAGTSLANPGAPWRPRHAVHSGIPLLEENVSKLEDGKWVLKRRTTYGFDTRGSMVRATLFSGEKPGPAIRKTWDFAYNPDRVWTALTEKDESDSGAKADGPLVLQELQVFQGPGGETIRIQNRVDFKGQFQASKDIRTTYADGTDKTVEYLNYQNGIWIPTLRRKVVRNAANQILRNEYENLHDNSSKVEEYVYNAQGKLLSRTTARESQELYTYDAKGNLLTYSRNHWHEGGNAWIRMSKEVHAYNAQGELLETNRETIIDDFKWEDMPGYNKEKITYDPVQRTQVYMHSAWHSGTTWTPTTKVASRRNAAGETVSQVRFGWNNGRWEAFSKDSMEFDPARNITVSMLFEPETWRGQSWRLTYKETQTAVYGLNGKLMSQRSDDGGNIRETAYLYDEKGCRISSMTRTSNASGQVFGGEWVTHRYLHAPVTPASIAGSGKPGMRKAFKPSVMAGKIRGRDGMDYNARGQALRGNPRP